MPFQPLPDNGPQRTAASDVGLFVVRLFTAVTFFYYQLIEQLGQARNYFWEKAEWDLVNQFTDKGLPLPGVLAVAFVIVFALSLAATTVGIFTRINALILLVLAGAILILPLDLSLSLNPQALVLYIGAFLGLALGGAGRASLDYRLAGRKSKKTNMI